MTQCGLVNSVKFARANMNCSRAQRCYKVNTNAHRKHRWSIFDCILATDASRRSANITAEMYARPFIVECNSISGANTLKSIACAPCVAYDISAETLIEPARYAAK